MADRARIASLIALGLIITIGAAPALAQTPVGVSPGAPLRITEVEGRCPTFTWSGVPGAAGYELVVYRLPDDAAETDAADDVELSPTDQALFAELPAGATAWQPELADGLAPGERYVWFIRAVSDPATGDGSDWSGPRFFEVGAAPSAEQVRQALDVLERWQAANEPGSPTLPSAAASAPAAVADSAAASAAATAAVADSAAGSGSGHPKSVPTATAAIRGSIPDTTGEVYGVVGLSSSADGAGIAAANLDGGPDLVLDGSADLLADAELSESGIDRPWGTPQTFDVSNSAGAGMTLRVDGIEVTTVESDLDADKLATGTVPDGRVAGTYSQALSLTNPGNDFTGDGAGLTGVDAETLDGVNGTDYATDAEAAGLVAAHAVSADHDGRYFTETELSTSGTGEAVHWDNLGGVPPGFADGIDNDTTYVAGLGIIVDGGEVRVDPAAFSTRLSILEYPGGHGSHSSIAIGADGFGLISYYHDSYHSLKLAHCVDVVCSDAVVTTLDSYGYSGINSAIAIGADGLGLISYYEGLQNDLKVAHCNDVACSSATFSTVDSIGDVGAHVSVAIGADGLPLISYYNATGQNLKVAHCNDVACSSATTPTLDSDGDVGQYTSIAIGADGLALISYYDATNSALKVAHCDNTICSSAAITTLESANSVGTDTSIAIGVDGLGLISYRDDSFLSLRIAHCDDILCSSASRRTVDISGDVGAHSSMAIGADGLGLISYLENGVDNLKVAHCNQTKCSTVTAATIDKAARDGTYTAIAVGNDGLALISYYDQGTGALKVAHLGIGVP